MRETLLLNLVELKQKIKEESLKLSDVRGELTRSRNETYALREEYRVLEFKNQNFKIENENLVSCGDFQLETLNKSRQSLLEESIKLMKEIKSLKVKKTILINDVEEQEKIKEDITPLIEKKEALEKKITTNTQKLSDLLVKNEKNTGILDQKSKDLDKREKELEKREKYVKEVHDKLTAKENTLNNYASQLEKATIKLQVDEKKFQRNIN